MYYNATKKYQPVLKRLFVTALFSIGLLILSGTQTHGQNITTYAGTGFDPGSQSGGYTGNGGQATAAELDQPVNVALDDSGNLFIADSHNHVIRKVETSTGIITTVAGDGYENGSSNGGYCCDNGPATDAELWDPWGIAFDDSDNMYIADYGNHIVRKVTKATGIITTVAGTPQVGTSGGDYGDNGQATAAHLAYPTEVAVDDSGNIYICDQWDNRVRRVTKATGIITTIAGSTGGFSGNNGAATAAQLYLPAAIALDDSGNVYIADQNEIRLVSKKTGIITNFAGDVNDNGGYSGDGLAATNAELNGPAGVHVDDSGNVYIADDNNNVIRKVEITTGIITTVAGNQSLGAGFNDDNIAATAAELNGPTRVAVDPCGNIYIADAFNNRVRKVTYNSNISGTISVTPLTASLCSGGSDTLKATGGISYTWSPAAGLSATTGATVVANPTATTTYTLSGSGGCSGTTVTTLSVIVTVTVSPSVAITPDSPSVCSGQSIVITASRNTGETYNWVNANDTSNSISVKPSDDTTYELRAANGTCVTDTFIAVKVKAAPELIIQPQGPQSVCPGQSIALSVPVSGSDYNWLPSATLKPDTGDTVLAYPVVQTTYTVSGIDSLGCLATSDSEVVSVSNAPNKPTITVSGDVLTSSATQGNQWVRNDSILTGATGENYTATIPGWYQVIAENPANGCSTTSDSVDVTDSSAGVNRLSAISNQLSIYPNPTGGEIMLTINSSVGELRDWNLQITDVLGRTVYTRLSLNYSNAIDLSNLASGVYFISVMNKAARAVVPVVKQ